MIPSVGTTLAARPLTLPMVLLGVIALALWAFGSGIPYGYDGIEIYFTYLIGHNAATFPHVNPLMADIAASHDPGAHPYYYSHHPNIVGHLLSQAMIRAGITDLRFHCLVSIALTVVGLYVGARVVRNIVGEAEAAAYLIVSALHYVGVLSWAPVLLRSLHFVFFWVAIALMQAYLVSPSSRRLLALGAWTYVVFVNDYALGPFLFLVQVLLVAVETRSWRQTVATSVVTGFAGVAAVASWLGVLIRQFGAEVVVQDIAYTYLARNAAELVTDPQAIVDFYRQHRIVFWGVFVETENLLHLTYRAWRQALTLGHGLIAPLIYGVMAYVAVVSLVGTLAPLEATSSAYGGRDMRQRAAAWLLRLIAWPAWGLIAGSMVTALAVREVFYELELGTQLYPVPPRGVVYTAAAIGSSAVMWTIGVASARRIRPTASRPRPRPATAAPSVPSLMSLLAAATLGVLLFTRRIEDWVPFNPATVLVGSAVVVGFATLQELHARLGSTPTAEAARPATVQWVLVATSLVVLFIVVDAVAVRTALAGVQRAGLPRADVVNGLATAAGVAVVLGAVALLVHYRRRGYARLTATIVGAWPVWVTVAALLTVSAIGGGILADLSREYRRFHLTGGGLERNVMRLVVVCLALAVTLPLAVWGGSRLLSRGVPTAATSTPGSLAAMILAPFVNTARPGIHLRNYVIVLLAATLVMSRISVGAFTANFIFTYKPLLVFMEDIVLAVVLVAAVRFVRTLPPVGGRRAAATTVLVGLALYWLAYQAALAYRHPPVELGAAGVLREEQFRGDSFVEEALYAAVWYYTGGIAYSVPWVLTADQQFDFDRLMFFRDREAKAREYRRPQYLACIRQHGQSLFACDRWIHRLLAVGFPVMRGENLLGDENYIIYRFPWHSQLRVGAEGALEQGDGPVSSPAPAR